MIITGSPSFTRLGLGDLIINEDSILYKKIIRIFREIYARSDVATNELRRFGRDEVTRALKDTEISVFEISESLTPQEYEKRLKRTINRKMARIALKTTLALPFVLLSSVASSWGNKKSCASIVKNIEEFNRRKNTLLTRYSEKIVKLTDLERSIKTLTSQIFNKAISEARSDSQEESFDMFKENHSDELEKISKTCEERDSLSNEIANSPEAKAFIVARGDLKTSLDRQKARRKLEKWSFQGVVRDYRQFINARQALKLDNEAVPVHKISEKDKLELMLPVSMQLRS